MDKTRILKRIVKLPIKYGTGTRNCGKSNSFAVVKQHLPFKLCHQFEIRFSSGKPEDPDVRQRNMQIRV